MSNNELYDLAIVGGGPAGTSAAYYAIRYGIEKVLVLEKESYPRNKPCGGALSHRNLSLLGSKAKESINCQINEIGLYSPTLKSFSYSNVPGHFVIREQFDAAMAEDAKDVGAKILEDTLVEDIKEIGDLFDIITNKGVFKAKYVILANGIRNDALTKKLGIRHSWPKRYMATCLVSETKIDLNALKDVGVTNTSLNIFFGVVPRGYGWYFVKKGYLNIGIGATADDLTDVGAKKVYNDFVKMLYDEGFIPKDLTLARAKGHRLAFKKPVKKTVFGKILLVGDVAGFVSPVTGEGLYYAIKSGQLAAKAISDNINKNKSLKRYQKAWRKDFGIDLGRYGLFLQNKLYKSSRRLEFVIKMGTHDKKVARYTAEMIYGLISYKKFLVKIVLRFPLTMVKMVF